MDELIGKYLAGEASVDETEQVEVWASASEENRRYLNQFKTIFDQAATVKEWQNFNTDAAWNKVKSKLKQPAGKVVPIQKPFLYWRVAATIALIALAGIFLFKTLSDTNKPLEVIAEQKTKGDTLPDGSNVYLNRKTQLTYSFEKAAKTHRVKLKGEAYFNINHEDDKKFIVEAEGIFIRDIGTSFNVKAYPESNTIEVVVIEGEVEFFTKHNAGIHLKANGKGVYDKTTKTFSIDQPEDNTLAYKTKFFSFSESTLSEVAAELNQVYDTKIKVANNLKDCLITVSFNNEDINEIATIIAETLNLEVKQENNQLILQGEGCGAQ